MRLKNVPGCRERIAESEYVVPEEELKERAGSWKSSFAGPGELHIEIGMGKGKFITTLAALHPEINYLGIEKFSSVLLRALEKRAELSCSNLYYLRFDAEAIEEVFSEGEVSGICLKRFKYALVSPNQSLVVAKYTSGAVTRKI